MDGANYQVFSRELIAVLRRKRSRSALSKKMGFKFNQVARWESGKRAIDWVEFLSLAAICGTKIDLIIQDTFRYSSPPNDQVAFLAHLGLTNDFSQFSKTTRLSRFKISRWTSGKQNIKLAEMLQIIDFCTTELYSFLSRITSQESAPTIYNELVARAKEAQEYYSLPATSLILSALDLDAYKKLPKHDDLFLKQKTGLDIFEIRKILANLLQMNMVSLKDGRYYSSRHQISPSLKREGIRKILSFHFLRNLKISQSSEPAPKSTMGFQVFSINSASYPRIKERYIQFYNDVSKIVNESQDGADQIYSMTISIINGEDVPSEDCSD
jgi:transcriptional regulator with XRE-family HTH domain